MLPSRFLLICLSALALAAGLLAADTIDNEIKVFEEGREDEAYMVVVHMPGSRISARFVVVATVDGTFLTRIVVAGDVGSPQERLSIAESTALLEKFRTFDWSAKPRKKKAEPSFGCSLTSFAAITFRARLGGSYRGIQADPVLVPELADLLGVVISKKADVGTRMAEAAPDCLGSD